MSETKSLATIDTKFSHNELTLIKDTVAKGATVPEFNLFLYRCQKLGLDPLRPGQVHFIKYGNNPGAIVVGIDGMRSIAGKTTKHEGTKRGLLLDSDGKCIGAFAEVYRAGWKIPAREEVSMAEYNTGKAQWLKMPETMIKKVAEAAALRMAFPDEVGDLYAEEEIDVTPQKSDSRAAAQEIIENTQARPEFEQNIEVLSSDIATTVSTDAVPARYVFKSGNASRKGKSIDGVDLNKIKKFVEWAKEEKDLHPDVVEDLVQASAYLKEREPTPTDPAPPPVDAMKGEVKNYLGELMAKHAKQ